MTDSIKDVTKIAHAPYTTISRALISPRINSINAVQIQPSIAGTGDPPSAVGHSLAIPRPRATSVALMAIDDLFHGDDLFLYNPCVETARLLPA